MEERLKFRTYTFEPDILMLFLTKKKTKHKKKYNLRKFLKSLLKFFFFKFLLTGIYE